MLLVARAMDMVIPQLGGNSESFLLVSKRKLILGLRLISRNRLKQSFTKGLRMALALIMVSRVIFKACTKPKPS
jgi:hypothetical protein